MTYSTPREPSARRRRLLYIHPGNSPPNADRERNAAYHLSKYLDGDLVTISWDTPEMYAEKRDEYERALGSFGYHPSLSADLRPGILRGVWQTLHYLFKSLQLSRHNGRYDAIVVYGPYKTAVAALLVKLFTGSPLIVQMITNPYTSLTAYSDSWIMRTKQSMMNVWLPFLLRFTDHLHLVYPDIVRPHPNNPPATVFPDFVAISAVPESERSDGYVLFLGFPWRLKGVDILIRAFNMVSGEFPQTRLKIVGHCPDPTPFEALASGNPRIEFHKAVPHAPAMSLMARCEFFALASRTDAMPRVLFEAWAAGKAVVASAVDGVPTIVRDGANGLLFPTEDVDALATCLRRLLSNPTEARDMGKEGRAMVMSLYTEDHYARAFADMIGRVAEARSQ